MRIKHICLVCFSNFLVCFLCPGISGGQVLLTGVLQQGAETNGQTAGSPIWNTLGNEVTFANIYLTQPNAGYTAPFINSGNSSGTSVSYALTAGTYQFYFFCMGFWDNNPGQYALNLFFSGDNTYPGISGYSAANTNNLDLVTAGLSTSSLDGSTTTVPAPGSLSFVSGGLVVSLTDYGFGAPGVFGGSALDRVGNLDSTPDLAFDSVGFFTLHVSPIPEPSIIALGGMGLSLILFRLRKF